MTTNATEMERGKEIVSVKTIQSLYNLEETNISLKTHNLPGLTHEEFIHLNHHNKIK